MTPPAPSPGRFRVAALLAALISFTGLGLLPLRAPDEIRVAEIGREMSLSGDFVVPRLAGEPFLEQPPLYYFAVSRSLAWFGTSAPAARLPSALLGFAMLLLVFDLARRIAGERAALVALCVVATVSGCFRYSHRCMVDGWLMAFVLLGWWAYLRATELRSAPAAAVGDGGASRSTAWPILLLHVAGALAFLTKGLIGPALLGLPVAVDLLLRRRWAFLFSPWQLVGALLLVGGCVLWPWLLYQRGGRPLLDGFLIQNLLYRVAPDPENYGGGHEHPEIWYYLVNLPGMAAPWIVALPAAAAMIVRRRAAARSNPSLALRASTFWATAFTVGFVLLSLAGTKRALYLLPLLPPLGIAVGIWLARAKDGNEAGVDDALRGRLHRITLGTLAALVLGLPALVVIALAALFRRLAPWRERLVGLVRDPWSGGPGSGAAGAAIAGVVFAGFVVSNFIDVPARYVDRDPRPVADALREHGLLDDDLIGYELDERTRAVVPWYTGHIVRNLRSIEEVVEFVRSHPRAALLVDDNHLAELPPELLASMKLLESVDVGRRTSHLYVSGTR